MRARARGARALTFRARKLRGKQHGHQVDLSYGNLFRLAVALISVAMVIYHVWAIAFVRRKRSISAAHICCLRFDAGVPALSPVG